MIKPMIEVRNLSKKYRYGQSQPYYTLRDTLAGLVPKKLALKKEKDEFWALNNVSFEVNKGEVLGIIGPNGSGKSTLLKILSQITPPTKGEAILRGRVGSLLEVGTGFHPELTGRENIYLNGAILGMSRAEINTKFQEIVDFSGVEKFIDTPVKRYSSGMYVRLAFAVAASLEPEILLIDEVLAVGDAEFQKKCLGKMGDVAKSGRTVLFVSHNLAAVQRLCDSILYIKEGQVEAFSKQVTKSIGKYLSDFSTSQGTSWTNKGNEYTNDYCTLQKIYLGTKSGRVAQVSLGNDKDIWIYYDFNIKNEGYEKIMFGYHLYTQDRTLLYKSFSIDEQEDKWPAVHKGKNLLVTKIPKHLLNEGDYFLEPALVIIGAEGKKYIVKPEDNSPTLYFKISGGLSESPVWRSNRGGLVAPVISWSVLE